VARLLPSESCMSEVESPRPLVTLPAIGGPPPWRRRLATLFDAGEVAELERHRQVVNLDVLEERVESKLQQVRAKLRFWRHLSFVFLLVIATEILALAAVYYLAVARP